MWLRLQKPNGGRETVGAKSTCHSAGQGQQNCKNSAWVLERRNTLLSPEKQALGNRRCSIRSSRAALRYSPNEVEFYLIDFKKGVEFKTYATHALPHARVIAIESEREFGLSVMQRLDQELKIRGDRFRELGVQDIGGYRDLADRDPKLGPMPRILFIVDEFQEFFVADDKVAQEAGLLLDRIVRQGRALASMHSSVRKPSEEPIHSPGAHSDKWQCESLSSAARRILI